MSLVNPPAFKAPPYLRRPNTDKSLLRPVLLALLVHVILGALLFFGVRWKNKPVEPTSAELFSPPVAVSPPKVDPVPVPIPAPKSELKPEPKPEPKPVSKTEIDSEKIPKNKPKPPPKDEKKEDLKIEKKEPPKKPDPVKETLKEPPKESAKDEAKRDEYLRSLVAKAGEAEAKSKASAVPALSAATDRGYGAKVAGALKANTSFQEPEELSGNPEAIFLVKLKPDCGIISVEMKKSSGLGAWDQAAERGIRRTNPFPAMSNGQCDSSLEIARSPKD